MVIMALYVCEESGKGEVTSYVVAKRRSHSWMAEKTFARSYSSTTEVKKKKNFTDAP